MWKSLSSSSDEVSDIPCVPLQKDDPVLGRKDDQMLKMTQNWFGSDMVTVSILMAIVLGATR
jgi:hypothetical protein